MVGRVNSRDTVNLALAEQETKDGDQKRKQSDQRVTAKPIR